VLPEWAQTATHLNPIFYMVNAFRYGLLGEGAIDMPLWSAFAVMAGFIVALTWLALRLLTKGVGLRS
jgi:ABC-2 type transport system permease protein